MRPRARARLVPIFVFLLAASFVGAAELSETQRLAGLCRIWGMLKYYHNGVTSGQIDWNQALLDAIPGVKAAGSTGAYEHQILKLIRTAGYAERVSFALPKEAHWTAIDWSWLDEAPYSTPLLAAVLKDIRDGHDPLRYCYYAPVYENGNLEFIWDKNFSMALAGTTEKTRLFSLFCYWNIIEYFFPYKDLMDRAWEETLLEFIPVFQGVSRQGDFHLVFKELTGRIDDSHGFTDSPTLMKLLTKSYTVGFEPSYVEGRTVVRDVYPALLGGCGIMLGDVVTHIDGRSTEDLRQEKRKYAHGSNEDFVQHQLDRLIFASSAASIELTIERGGQPLTIVVPGVSYTKISVEAQKAEDATVPARLLPGNFGYVHLGALRPEQVAEMTALLRDTRAIIFDIRNYPQATVGEINSFLNPESQPWAEFHYPLVGAPGYFGGRLTYRGPVDPNPDHYRGQIIVLVDIRSISYSEYFSMALQSTGRATVIGSQTAGADGNISRVYLPDGILTVFTGLGIYYPDGRPTQRIGIVPDIEARPTIAGIRAGRDEVLERAVQFLVTGR